MSPGRQNRRGRSASARPPDAPTFFATPAHFRAWLARNADKASVLHVGFYKVGTGRPSITWPESVDEALCYGWIASAKLPATRARRLARLIEGAASGVRLMP